MLLGTVQSWTASNVDNMINDWQFQDSILDINTFMVGMVIHSESSNCVPEPVTAIENLTPYSARKRGSIMYSEISFRKANL